MGQFKECPEPLHFALVEQFDMEPGVGAVDGDANGNNVQQLVAFTAVGPGAFNRLKIIDNRRTLRFPHHSPHITYPKFTLR